MCVNDALYINQMLIEYNCAYTCSGKIAEMEAFGMADDYYYGDYVYSEF